MLNRLSDGMTSLLVKKQVLDRESYEVYRYAIEVIFLNGSILLLCMLISVFSRELPHMLTFVLFFVPLRMLAGGYHCETSGACLVCSARWYAMTVCLVRFGQAVFTNIAMIPLTIIAMVVLIVESPSIHPNHPLTEKQICRNRAWIRTVILAEFILMLIFWKHNRPMFASEVVFIIMAAWLLAAGKWKQNLSR